MAHSRMQHDIEDHDVIVTICHWTDTKTTNKKSYKNTINKKSIQTINKQEQKHTHKTNVMSFIMLKAKIL